MHTRIQCINIFSQGNADFGPIYVTQFNTKSCAPGEDGEFTKTCHCTDASFMYNQNFVVPRVPGHFTSDQEKYDTWRASENTQSILAASQATWGQFFRTGTFPEYIQDINSIDFPTVNTVDESSFTFKSEATFVDECTVLDDVLGDNYLNRDWEHIGENFEYTPQDKECTLNENGYLPSDYSGSSSTTKSGLTCQNWEAQEPHSHDIGQDLGNHNHCRNPDGEHSAWCYTTEPNVKWEYCVCQQTEQDLKRLEITSEECTLNDQGYLPGDYAGTGGTTASGGTCQNWAAQEPHVHDRTPANYPGTGLGDHNSCRNPDGEHSSWCYTTDPENRWEYCGCP